MPFRLLIAAIALYLSWWSVRMAIADTEARHNNLESALRLEPEDAVLKARQALQNNDAGDQSPQTAEELHQAAQLDPLNPDLQIALGLREEFANHLPAAERDLIQAAQLDHRFKPAWTLASFYVRNDQPDKAWPMLRRALNLNPLAYDPAPVFDLCWNLTTDSKRILDLIPARGAVPVQYLYYLIARKRFDAAMEVWPRALDSGLASADLASFPDYLIQAYRTPDAVNVWNQLVARGIIDSGKLDPAAGASIADPDFSRPPLERGFGWRVAPAAIKSFPGLKFEFDGEEPENMLLLTTFAPLIPGRTYRLIWNGDSSRLSSSKDPGFVLQIGKTECQPLLKPCEFTSDAANAQLNLIYRRAPGTTRVKGALEIETIKLEPRP